MLYWYGSSHSWICSFVPFVRLYRGGCSRRRDCFKWKVIKIEKQECNGPCWCNHVIKTWLMSVTCIVKSYRQNVSGRSTANRARRYHRMVEQIYVRSFLGLQISYQRCRHHLKRFLRIDPFQKLWRAEMFIRRGPRSLLLKYQQNQLQRRPLGTDADVSSKMVQRHWNGKKRWGTPGLESTERISQKSMADVCWSFEILVEMFRLHKWNWMAQKKEGITRYKGENPASCWQDKWKTDGNVLTSENLGLCFYFEAFVHMITKHFVTTWWVFYTICAQVYVCGTAQTWFCEQYIYFGACYG